MRKAIIVGVLMFLVSPALALSIVPPPVLGREPIGCDEWTQVRKKGGPEASPYRQWALGYLSGWMSTRRPNQKVIHPNEVGDLLKSLDRRCKIYPYSYVASQLANLLSIRFDGRPYDPDQFNSGYPR